MEGIEAVIERLEKQKAAIESALSALHGVGGITPVVGNDGPSRRSLAQKARWAAVREGAASKKRGLSAAGRARLSENMRKRWAAKRTAAQAKKRAPKKAS